MTEATKSCTWTQCADFDAEYWDTDCGQARCFETGTPAENNVRFCHFCGCPVVTAMPTPPEDDDD